MSGHFEAWVIEMNNEQFAFVVHRQMKNDSIETLTCLTHQQGCIDLFSRLPKSQTPMFQQLRLDISNKNFINSACSDAKAIPLKGNTLYAGLYLNELIVRLLIKHTLSESFCGVYASTLHAIALSDNYEPELRYFEKILLDELGLGIDYFKDINGRAVQSESFYEYQVESGFRLTADSRKISGETLVQIRENNWQSKMSLIVAKQINRQTLQKLLGREPLRSRQYFLKR